jgi:hypothetical protein
MNFLEKIIQNKLEEAKKSLFDRLDEIAAKRLNNLKEQVVHNMFEATRSNSNIIRMGRVQKIRRRIRRNAKGRIVVQKNVRRSGVKGYRVSGNTVQRIPAAQRIQKARLLKRSWKTTRRAKLRRTLLKRKMSMRRRAGLGLK